ncbi:MAG TPA: DUF2283 domain-containing protein [Armatimonadota bacterium]|nr:DUF2283 domain-containing protein [Armatimonadota bacterium]
MKVTYDEQIDAVYCYVSNREAARTIQVAHDILLDLDSDENLRGINILSASRVFPVAAITDSLLLDDDERDATDWPFLIPTGRAG